MSELTGGMTPPKLKTADEYRDFMRTKAGSKIEPGSEAEKTMLENFREARALGRAATEAQRPQEIKEELKAAEEGMGNSYVRPEDSQALHHPDKITITKVGGGSGEEIPVRRVPGPLKANENPQTGIIDPSILSAIPQAAGDLSPQVPDINPKAPGVDQPPQRV